METWGYKFSDTSVLNYQCVVELCKKAQGECNGLTPPNCGRGKRSIGHLGHRNRTRPESRDTQIDLVTNVDVLDTLEPDSGVTGPPQDLLKSLNRQIVTFHPRSGAVDSAMLEGKMCLSTPAFGVMMSLTVLLFLTAFISSALICLRVRSGSAKSTQE